jgi:hypothetical protein
MLESIPMELRLLPQWVAAGPTKEPVNPRNGYAASPTDANTWGTFDEAVRAGLAHVGFVLCRSDPYTIIDLDNPFRRKDKSLIVAGDADFEEALQNQTRQEKIYNAFDSYAELSQSGEGVHIVVRGSIPKGVRRDKVEIYSADRYMICTGRVLRNAPITDHQLLLDAIFAEMDSTIPEAELVDVQSSQSDDQIYRMASTAANADKFNQLWRGDLTGYPSQSEADFALLSMLCFYTRDNEQVRRLFRFSALGKREKAVKNDVYLNRCLRKIRAVQSPPVDLSGFLNAHASVDPATLPEPVYHAPAPAYVVDSPPAYAEEPAPTVSRISLPPGLVGEMAQYFYSSATRPVEEVSLMAALSLCAGVLGRSYNVSNTGLNQYLILLAKTGSGKEGAASGIDALVAETRKTVPAVDEFVGPGTFASGQALIRVLDRHACFVSVLGEFGLTLQSLCDKNASPANVVLRKVLLDLYAKSGFDKVLRPSVYSDQEKNTGLVCAPNVTILGESTPETFFHGLDSSHIAEGLIPRFCVLEYDGPRPARNPHAFHRPPGQLIGRFSDAVTRALATAQNQTCAPIQFDSAATRLLDAFDSHADTKINGASADVEMQLWNRAHLKALKLAGLLAAGCNLDQPVITGELAQWAIDFVGRDVGTMAAKFSQGAVGQGDHRQEDDIRSAVERYPQLTAKQRKQYKVPNGLLDKNVVPYIYLKTLLRLRSSFKTDRRGAVEALQKALADMVRAGTLALVPPDQALKELGTTAPVYIRDESW